MVAPIENVIAPKSVENIKTGKTITKTTKSNTKNDIGNTFNKYAFTKRSKKYI